MKGDFFNLKVFQEDTETKDSRVASLQEQSIATIAVHRGNKGGSYFLFLTKLSSYSQFFFSFEN